MPATLLTFSHYSHVYYNIHLNELHYVFKILNYIPQKLYKKKVSIKRSAVILLINATVSSKEAFIKR